MKTKGAGRKSSDLSRTRVGLQHETKVFVLGEGGPPCSGDSLTGDDIPCREVAQDQEKDVFGQIGD